MLSLFFVPMGRIRRRVFWVGMLVLWALAVGIWFAAMRTRLGLTGWLIQGVLLWPWLCLGMKRLHDRGRSGWWMLLPVLVNALVVMVLAVSFVMAFSFGSSAPDPETGRVSSTGAMNLAGMATGLIALNVALLFNLIFLLWVGLARGNAGVNRFGASPAATAQSAPEFS